MGAAAPRARFFPPGLPRTARFAPERESARPGILGAFWPLPLSLCRAQVSVFRPTLDLLRCRYLGKERPLSLGRARAGGVSAASPPSAWCRGSAPSGETRTLRCPVARGAGTQRWARERPLCFAPKGRRGPECEIRLREGREGCSVLAAERAVSFLSPRVPRPPTGRTSGQQDGETFSKEAAFGTGRHTPSVGPGRSGRLTLAGPAPCRLRRTAARFPRRPSRRAPLSPTGCKWQGRVSLQAEEAGRRGTSPPRGFAASSVATSFSGERRGPRGWRGAGSPWPHVPCALEGKSSLIGARGVWGCSSQQLASPD